MVNLSEHRFHIPVLGIGYSVDTPLKVAKYGISSVLSSAAGEKDIYLSDASPLGIPFNNLRNSTMEVEKLRRAAVGKFGSPCTKKYLKFNTELSEKPVCTASIEFHKLKIAQLQKKGLSADEYKKEFDKTVAKEFICEGLTFPAITVNKLDNKKKTGAVSVCPGPNLAYFSKIASLREMVDHIYGRINLITAPERPNMFIKELSLNLDYFHKLIKDNIKPLSGQAEKFLGSYRENLLSGINYYRKMIVAIQNSVHANLIKFSTILR